MHLYGKLQKDNPFAGPDLTPSDQQLADLGLLLALAVDRLANSNNRSVRVEDLLDVIAADYVMSKSFDDARHLRSISDLVTQYHWTFFGRDISAEAEGKSVEERRTILAPAMPAARLFWFFCIFMCQTLFEGDHVLTPDDAQLIGLIDEVCGGGPVESLREYLISSQS